jgi:outer membrane protein
MALCAAALILLAASPAGAYEIGARALYWFPDLKADIRADNEGLYGTTLDVRDRMGVGNKSFPSFEVFGSTGKHALSLAYTPLSYSGTTTLTSAINFNGKTFAAGTSVDTSLKLRMLDLEYRYRLFDAQSVLAGLSLSVLGQVKYLDGEVKVEAPSAATSADYSLRVPIPMIGAGANLGLLAKLLEARAKVAGVTFSHNYLVEAMAELAYTPFPFLAVNAGYKYMKLKIDHRDVFLDSQFSGPYVGLSVSF